MEEPVSKTLKLNNGNDIPKFGLGTLLVKNVADITYAGIKEGVRLIDTAWIYQNEKEVGKGINKALDDKLVKREDLFIITKVWATHKSDPEASLIAQLKDLNLDYVDLYLDHAPVAYDNDKFFPQHIFWKNMEGVVKKGLAKSIGVCSYNVQLLMNLLSFAEIKPVVNQFEFHPYLTQPGLVKFCKDNNVKIMAYNSLGKNFFVEKYHSESKLNLIEDKIIGEVGKKYNKTNGVILLNWAISQDIIVIPSTSSAERFKENLQCLSFKMSDEDIQKISKLNIPFRFGSVQGGAPDIFA